MALDVARSFFINEQDLWRFGRYFHLTRPNIRYERTDVIRGLLNPHHAHLCESDDIRLEVLRLRQDSEVDVPPVGRGFDLGWTEGGIGVVSTRSDDMELGGYVTLSHV